MLIGVYVDVCIHVHPQACAVVIIPAIWPGLAADGLALCLPERFKHKGFWVNGENSWKFEKFEGRDLLAPKGSSLLPLTLQPHDSSSLSKVRGRAGHQGRAERVRGGVRGRVEG